MRVEYFVEKDDWNGWNVMKRVYTRGDMNTCFVAHFDKHDQAEKYRSELQIIENEGECGLMKNELLSGKNIEDVTINDLKSIMIKIHEKQEQLQNREIDSGLDTFMEEQERDFHQLQELEEKILTAWFSAQLKLFDEIVERNSNSKYMKELQNSKWKVDFFRREDEIDAVKAVLQFMTRRHMIHGINRVGSV